MSIRTLCFASFLLVIPFIGFAQKTIYVAGNGNNSNNGLSEAAPIQTIAHLNTINLSAGDKVLFRRGDVFDGQIEVKSSGTSANPITYSAYGDGNNPVISGAELLNTVNASGNIYEASVNQPVLAINIAANKAILARQPNSGFYTIQSGTKTSLADGTHLNKGSDYFKGANIRIRTTNWTFEAREITSSSSNSVNWTEDLYYTAKPEWGYYLDNHRDFLDNHNEWYFDGDNNKVLIYSDNEPVEVYGTVYEYGMIFNTNVSHVVVDGIKFQYQKYDGIYLYGTCQNITITNCEFNNIERHGISFVGNFTNINISNNTFQHIYGSGFMVNSLTDSEVKNNNFSDIGMWQGYGAVFGYPINNKTGFSINGKNNHVHHNVVKNTGYNGIRVDGEGNLTEKNLIQNACLKLNDGGGIYFHGNGTKNSTFRYNVVDNVVGNLDGTPSGYIIASMYFDNGSNNITAENNVLVNSSHMGVLVNRGTNAHTLKGNLIAGYAGNGIVFADDVAYTRSVNNVFSENTLASSAVGTYFVSKTTTHTTDNYNPGTLSNNTYFNPYDAIGFRSSKTGGDIKHRNFSLKAWNDYTNEDINSENIYLGWNEFKAIEKSGDNFIQNGSFDNDLQNWSKWTNGTSEMNHMESSALGDGALKLELTSTGDNDISFAINVLSEGLQKEQWYELSFAAVSNKNGHVQVIPKRHFGAYDNIGKSRTFPLYTSASSYTYTFKAEEDIDPARIDFQIGVEDGHLIIDSVRLEPVTVEHRIPSAHLKYFYNASDNTQSINLPSGIFMGLDGAVEQGSIELAAWSGVVLYSNEDLVLSTKKTLADFQDEKLKTQIFPNPVNDLINIKLPHAWEGPIRMALMDTNGANLSAFQRKVSSRRENYIQMDIHDFPQGFYYLLIVHVETNQREMHKILKK